ncbi:hypothetical protein NITLEN_10061 [Nitrospira lenta]|uniref:Uncharacterized protein n=1 Tax=Nitrospira lenta TaxID=1436998 RepID=A0A330KZP9_9BACT|nr:hypothetical protein NITLEN_10061 [Nitrospira lenta]
MRMVFGAIVVMVCDPVNVSSDRFPMHDQSF